MMKTWPSAVGFGLCLGMALLPGVAPAAEQQKTAAAAQQKTPAAAQQMIPVAVFAFGLDDTSLQGQPPGAESPERKRLAALDGQLRDLLEHSGCCSLVDMAHAASVAEGMDLRTCKGCEVDLARGAGARLAVTGWVQKVSNLILNINLVVRDVATGQVADAGSVDIRGNTDESWSRGLAYLLQNRLHPSQWKADP